MTAPALVLGPATHITESPGSPLLGDLWDASARVSGDRLRDGITVWPSHGSGHGTWPLECGPDDDPGSKDGNRPDPIDFHGLVVWAADECGTVGNTLERTRSMAALTLDYEGRAHVETHFITAVTESSYIADVPTPAALAGVNPLALALGGLEQAMAALWRHAGVIHASRALLAPLASLSLVRVSGSSLVTPGGNRWAFGVGYDEVLGRDLVGTGPTEIHTQPVPGVELVDERQNNIYAVAEYIAVPLHYDTALRIEAG